MVALLFAHSTHHPLTVMQSNQGPWSLITKRITKNHIIMLKVYNLEVFRAACSLSAKGWTHLLKSFWISRLQSFKLSLLTVLQQTFPLPSIDHHNFSLQSQVVCWQTICHSQRVLWCQRSLRVTFSSVSQVRLSNAAKISKLWKLRGLVNRALLLFQIPVQCG